MLNIPKGINRKDIMNNCDLNCLCISSVSLSFICNVCVVFIHVSCCSVVAHLLLNKDVNYQKLLVSYFIKSLRL